MLNIVMETLLTLVAGIIFLNLLRAGRSARLRKESGWSPIVAGFGLILLGTLLDLSDNFPALNRFVVLGETPAAKLLNMAAGYLPGFLLVAAGLRKWLPAVIRLKKTEGALKNSQAKLTAKVRDLSASERAHRKTVSRLKCHTSFIEVLLEALPNPVFYKDREGRYIGCNRLFAKHTGVSAEEISGKTVMELWPERDASVYHGKDLELMQNPGRQVYEWRVLNRHGENRDVIFCKDVFFDENGSAAGIIGIYTDITDRKRAEEEVINLNMRLEEKVRERTRELEDAVAILKKTQDYLIQSERMATLGGLVAGLSHEINTPIAVSLTYASYLHDKMTGLDQRLQSGTLSRKEMDECTADVRQAVGSIMVNLKRTADMVGSFKRVAVDQSSEERRRFNVRSHIEETLLSLHHLLKRKRHRVVIECPETLAIAGYPGALSQVITNFIMNSLLHGFEGIEAGEITFDVCAQGRRLRLVYSDNGSGIPIEDQKRIFDPFFTTRRESGGSGLGMSIVHDLVTRQLGGEITCKSATGQGTAFTVTLPMDD